MSIIMVLVILYQQFIFQKNILFKARAIWSRYLCQFSPRKIFQGRKNRSHKAAKKQQAIRIHGLSKKPNPIHTSTTGIPHIRSGKVNDVSTTINSINLPINFLFVVSVSLTCYLISAICFHVGKNS